jgi:hypothetical protein
MQQNEFEKQLRKLMGEDFRLSPSAFVWEKVKAAIEKRRRPWPLVILLLVAVLGGAYFFSDKLSEKEFKNDTVIHLDTLQNIKSHLKQQDISQKVDSFSDAIHEQPEKIIASEPTLKVIKESFEKNTKRPLPAKQYQNFIDTSKLALQKREDGNDAEKGISGKTEIRSVDPVNPGKTTDDSLITLEKNQEGNKINAAKQTVSDKGTAKRNNMTIPGKPADKKNTKRNLSFGITIYGGRSNTVDNLLNQTKEARPSNAIGPGINAAVVRPEPPFTSSYNYSLGGFVQKDISKKLSVSAGINYAYFTTKAQTTDITSTITLAVPGLASTEFINSYYRPGNNQLQVNKYKFIEASFGLHQTIINSKKIPVYADAGISAMRLLSAKTLIYDNSSNAYYHKNDWLQKTQASGQLGISLHIKLNKNNILVMGPEVQYGFTNLLKNKNYTPQHLFSYGLQGRWVIGKN